MGDYSGRPAHTSSRLSPIFETTLGPDHPYTQAVRTNLASLPPVYRITHARIRPACTARTPGLRRRRACGDRPDLAAVSTNRLAWPLTWAYPLACTKSSLLTLLNSLVLALVANQSATLLKNSLIMHIISMPNTHFESSFRFGRFLNEVAT